MVCLGEANNLMKIFSALILMTFLTAAVSVAGASPLKKDEEVIFFPTGAYFDSGDGHWVVPVHGWVFEMEENSWWREGLVARMPDWLDAEVEDANRSVYERRAGMFLVDNERNKDIEVLLGDRRHSMSPSRPNGHFNGAVRVDVDQARAEAADNWILYRVDPPEGDQRVFLGRSLLIDPVGVSVISDIDDTIKISNVRDEKELLRNTFLRPFEPVPDMSELYTTWAAEHGAVFHYVSGSPWQLYPALADFLLEAGFPLGSFHLKSIRMRDRTFFDLFASQDEYKRPIIESILDRFPGRRFILVGDSGEEDPEIYAAIAKEYRDRIIHVFIREDAHTAPDDGRYARLFADWPSERWTLFRGGQDLMELKIFD